MGQSISRVPQAPALGGSAAGREPIGRYIAQQRRLRGIDLEELSARTRIPRRSLERLEAGAFDRSPDGFSRGFVRTVAEAIGLDADDAVARMLPEPDAAQLGPPRAALWLAAGAGLALVAGAVLLLRALDREPAPAPAASRLPLRVDYVRALAEAHGIEPDELTARDAVLPPPPAELPAPEAVASVDGGQAPAAPAEAQKQVAGSNQAPSAPSAAASPPSAPSRPSTKPVAPRAPSTPRAPSAPPETPAREPRPPGASATPSALPSPARGEATPPAEVDERGAAAIVIDENAPIEAAERAASPSPADAAERSPSAPESSEEGTATRDSAPPPTLDAEADD